ncbi:LytTR family DNA-binding domain-containing protein [Neolewinella lacunae]|uniref:LytTR family transcriptional regulator n=1 Tax=Neolewinella lacunae TaxID=1517758 RepID=A0A923PRH8_9BACT|nr:LytTR family DNA-binding domain-containing protein [Neolewinella lacunae]MBC6996154.1 LytTR family transcriptional regulator [Neolewinella lacunae]MDN3634006.1 LytTR family DNA-binding domain-containing protein [Neolewinella lacunae]
MPREKERSEANVAALLLPVSNGYRVVRFADIICCRAEKSYSAICLAAGEEVIVSYGLSRLVQVLPEDMFFRCHHSYLINCSQVEGIDKVGSSYFLLLGEYRVPVSRSQQQAVRGLFYQL